MDETENKESYVRGESPTGYEKIGIETEKDIADYKKKSFPDKPILAQESCHRFCLEKDGNEKKENHAGVKDDLTEDEYCEHSIWL